MSFVSIVCEEPVEVTVKARYVVTVDGKTSEYEDEVKTTLCKQSLIN